jgi:glycosyltransferase involved in cell wall biosynthesis
VLGDVPTLRELWRGCAVFVPPDDDDALARAITGLAADDQRRRAWGAAARERSLAFTRARMVDAYLDVYAEVQS